LKLKRRLKAAATKETEMENSPGFSILTLFNVRDVQVGALESCIVADKRTWVRELTICDEAGNKLRIGLYANTQDALALGESWLSAYQQEYAAEQSATALCMLAGD
jgi:hypothetical protein